MSTENEREDEETTAAAATPEASEAPGPSAPFTPKMTYKEALRLHVSEVNDPSWTDICPVCARFTGNRTQIFSHLLSKHGLNCGHPNGIFNAHGLLLAIREKFDNLICLYCEGSFPSQAVLRKHMKHRKHYRISRVNTTYDQFYLSNYRSGKSAESTVRSHLGEPDMSSSNSSNSVSEGDNSEDDGDDYDDDDDEAENVVFDDFSNPTPTKCLFCTVTHGDPLLLAEHCRKEHAFAFEDITEMLKLDFYGGIKFVNYVRSCVSENKCPYCELKCGSNTELLDHFTSSSHLDLKLFPGKPYPWDDDKYLIPENCNDPILYCLGQFGCVFDE